MSRHSRRAFLCLAFSWALHCRSSHPTRCSSRPHTQWKGVSWPRRVDAFPCQLRELLLAVLFVRTLLGCLCPHSAFQRWVSQQLPFSSYRYLFGVLSVFVCEVQHKWKSPWSRYVVQPAVRWTVCEHRGDQEVGHCRLPEALAFVTAPGGWDRCPMTGRTSVLWSQRRGGCSGLSVSKFHHFTVLANLCVLGAPQRFSFLKMVFFDQEGRCRRNACFL